MHVRMITKIGGYRNGEEWPDTGGVVEVPDHEGRDLIVAGYAEENDGPDPAVEAQPEDGDTAGDDVEAPVGDDEQAGVDEPDGDSVDDKVEVKSLRLPGEATKPKRTRKS